jgi:hypothetical protein
MLKPPKKDRMSFDGEKEHGPILLTRYHFIKEDYLCWRVDRNA